MHRNYFAISLYTGIKQNKFVYSYESGDLSKPVKLRVTGTLSNFNLDGTNAKYLSVGDEILVKNLGEVIKDDEYNSKFDNWVYNTPTKEELDL